MGIGELVRVLLNCNVRKVDEHVVHLSYVGRVLLVAEPAKPELVKPDLKGFVTCDQDVHSKVELFSPYEHWIFYVPTYDVVFLKG